MFDSYKERENAAEMRAVKTSQMDYLLTIRSARAEDQGQYQCEVWQENMNEDGTLKKIQKLISSPETVSITAKGNQRYNFSSYTVKLWVTITVMLALK